MNWDNIDIDAFLPLDRALKLGRNFLIRQIRFDVCRAFANRCDDYCQLHSIDIIVKFELSQRFHRSTKDRQRKVVYWTVNIIKLVSKNDLFRTFHYFLCCNSASATYWIYVTLCQKSEKRNSYVLKIKFCNFKEWWNNK